MRRLLFVLGALLVLLVAVDFAARAVATNELRDRARERVEGVRTTAPVSVNRGLLTIGSGATGLHIRIPRGPLMACDATSVVVRQGVIDLSCTVHDVPVELLRRGQAASSRPAPRSAAGP